MTEWDPQVKAVSKVTMATHSDVILVSFSCTGIIARVMHQMRGSLGGDKKVIYSRQVSVMLSVC